MQNASNVMNDVNSAFAPSAPLLGPDQPAIVDVQEDSVFLDRGCLRAFFRKGREQNPTNLDNV